MHNLKTLQEIYRQTFCNKSNAKKVCTLSVGLVKDMFTVVQLVKYSVLQGAQ